MNKIPSQNPREWSMASLPFSEYNLYKLYATALITNFIFNGVYFQNQKNWDAYLKRIGFKLNTLIGILVLGKNYFINRKKIDSFFDFNKKGNVLLSLFR